MFVYCISLIYLINCYSVIYGVYIFQFVLKYLIFDSSVSNLTCRDLFEWQNCKIWLYVLMINWFYMFSVSYDKCSSCLPNIKVNCNHCILFCILYCVYYASLAKLCNIECSRNNYTMFIDQI